MLKIIFSAHALFQTKERKISKKSVIETIKNPDKILTQDNFRKRALRIFEKNKKKYLLVVVYEENRTTINIVTTFITSKLKKYS